MSVTVNGPAGPSRLKIRSVARAANHLVALTGELDQATSSQVEAEMLRVEENGAEQIIMDLSGVEFIDSSGIAFLIAAYRRCGEDRNQLRFIPSRSPDVGRLLELCGLEHALPFIER
jgi:anti-anti-sigma factor